MFKSIQLNSLLSVFLLLINPTVPHVGTARIISEISVHNSESGNLLDLSETRLTYPTLSGTSGNSSENASDITVNIPTGNSGDLLFSVIAVDQNSTINIPTGWTGLVNNNAGSSGPSIAVIYRIADGTESANLTINGWTNEQVSATITRFENVNTTSPINTSSTASNMSANGSSPSTTTTSDSTLVLRIHVTDEDLAISAPSNTDDFPVLESSTESLIAIAYSQQDDAGSTDSATWTHGAENWYSVTLALTPENTPILPEVTAFAIQPSCINDTPQSDGYLQLSSVSNGDRIAWSSGTTFTGDTDYDNASAIGTLPFEFNIGLSNADAGDYTIRVFDGASDCFTDAVVTLNTQDCTVGCDCTEMLYLNEPTTDGAVHKFSVATDGTLTEIGSPWFDNAVAMEEVTSPHGVAVDLNGFVYIGESNASGEIRKFTCDGEIFPESEFAISNGGQTNIATIDNILYTNKSGDSFSFDFINAYDICTGDLIGTMEYCEDASSDWGFFIDPRTNEMYATTDAATVGTSRLYYFSQSDFDLDPTTCVSDVTVGEPLPQGAWGVFGVTTDIDRNVYVIIKHTGDDRTYIRKYGPAPNFQFIGQSAVDSGQDGAVYPNGGYGYGDAIGIIYSETANRIYVSTTSPIEDCVALFDTDLNYLGSAVPPVAGSDNAKGIGIVKECCPTNNNVTVDTTLCAASVNDILFLQELISCDGSICEGLWQEGMSNTGMTYDPCNNSVTIDALSACGSFTLESDGVGNNPQCGAFKITVNIKVENVSTPVITAGTAPACANNNDPGAITISTSSTGSSTVSYRWQSSTTSCTDGFTDIASAPTDGTAYDPSSISVETYYRVIAEVNNTTCLDGACADTSNCIILTPESGCIPVCANPTVTAYAIQPSCTDGIAGNDGYLQLSSVTDGDRYHWSTGSTFDDNGGADTYANATDLTGATYPLQFNAALGNADVGDFTIRVYNGEDGCFTDVVVTLNTQDCAVGCECKEIIYLNEPTTGGAVHKYEIDMTDGGLTELAGVNGIPWFDNAAQGESITSPHGAGTDINGNVYIGEEAASGRIRKLDCNGNIKPVSEFSAGIGGQFSIGSIGNLIYANNNTTAGNRITAYDACSGELDSWVRLTGIQSSGNNRDWGFYIDPRTKTMYSTSTWTPNGTFNGFYVFNQSDFGTPGNYINRITPSPALPNDVAIRGITTDAAGNIYVVVKGNSACGKCSYLLKYDSSFNLLATGPTDLIDGDGGWHNSIGIVYSETADLLYVSSESTTDDCLYIFDTDLVPVRGEIPSPGTGDNGKGIAILQECCPTNNNQVVDTTLCAASIGDVLFLAELINCNGSICEGMWQEGMSNTGMTYDPCDNSIVIDALDACGTFTLESDGTGNNPQCGAFKIVVNINVAAQPEAAVFAIQPSCVDNLPQNNGYLQISEVTNAARYNFSVGSTYTGDTDWANAIDLTSATFPLQFNTGLSNPNGEQEYTVRFFSPETICGEHCYIDYTVTLKEQDCTKECDCQEYLYSNDTDNDLVHKFLINPTDSTLIEVGNPWFEPINRPHGGAMDLNGVLYFAEKNDATTSSLFKIDCDGNFIDTLFYGDFDGTQFNNFVMEGNILYVNGAGGENVKAYDICEERFIGTIDYCCGNFNWELFEGADGNMYTTDKVNDSLYIYHVPYDISLYNGTVVLQPVIKLFDAAMADRNDWGVETDLSGNWYVVLHNSSFDTRVLKFDASGIKTGEVIDLTSDGVGFFDGRGVVWSEATDLLYVASDKDDCVAVIAASSMTYLESLSIPGGGGKDLSLVKECCPTNNTVTIDTTLCTTSLDDVIFLQDLIGCDGGICEGVWQEGGSNTGLTYDPCDNSVTITALDACGAFTLESDGTGNNPQCGAFKIEVNISVNVVTASVVAADQTICAGEDPAAFTVTTPAIGGTLTHQWQSSTTDCNSGFSNITDATNPTYDPPAGINSTTYYRVITSGTNTACRTGACIDTSNCITITVIPNPDISVNDETICYNGSTTIEATVTNQVLPLTYTWTVPTGVTAPGNVASFPTSVGGTYSVEITDGNGCTSSGSGTITALDKPCFNITIQQN